MGPQRLKRRIWRSRGLVAADTMPTMTWLVLLLIPAGLAISWPVTTALARVGRRVGALDSPGAVGHVKQLRAVPNIGGIAIWLAVVAPVATGLAALWFIDEGTWRAWLPALADHLPRIRQSTPTAAAMLVGATLLHVIGLIDDRRGLGPWPKLIVQAIVAAAMTIWFDVRLLTLLGAPLSILLTIGWIVVITNAINFMDNMDGLAGGVSAIAATLFMAATIINQQWFIAATLALLVGALAGFLLLNFPPARIFMGDGGSLVVGFLLAVLTARTTFVDEAAEDGPLGGGWYGVFMPVIVLAIPLYDFTSVTWLRLMQGRSPLVGDQQHFSHRLVQRGFSRRGAVLLIWAATAVTGIGGVSLGRLEPWQAVLVGVQTLLVLFTLALAEHGSRRATGRFTTEHTETTEKG